MGLRLLLAIAILLGGGVARADDKPWAKGVSKENQKKALALYTEGNGYFEQDLFGEALKRFEAALEAWEPPGDRSGQHRRRVDRAVARSRIDRAPGGQRPRASSPARIHPRCRR